MTLWMHIYRNINCQYNLGFFIRFFLLIYFRENYVNYGEKGQEVKKVIKKKVGLFDLSHDEATIDHNKMMQNDSEIQLFEDIRHQMDGKKKKKQINTKLFM